MPKNKLIIIRGMPASGKSTLARGLVNQLKKHGKTSLLILDEFKWVQISHDKRTSEDFKLAFDNYLFCLKNLLKHGFTVVTEDTFLPLGKDKSTDTKPILFLARRMKIPVKQLVLGVEFETALKRNSKRPMVVPEKQMRTSHAQIYKNIADAEMLLDGNQPSEVVLKTVAKYLNDK